MERSNSFTCSAVSTASEAALAGWLVFSDVTVLCRRAIRLWSFLFTSSRSEICFACDARSVALAAASSSHACSRVLRRLTWSTAPSTTISRFDSWEVGSDLAGNASRAMVYSAGFSSSSLAQSTSRNCEKEMNSDTI